MWVKVYLLLHFYRRCYILNALNEKFNKGLRTVKRTFQPSKIRRARTHGFRARMKTASGRTIINRRRQEGRSQLTRV